MASTAQARIARGRASARGGGRRSLERGEVDDARYMPAGRNKAQEIGRCDGGGAVVRERMVVERIVIEHRGIEHRSDAVRDIVDQRKRGHAAGAHSEDLEEVGGTAE